MQTACAGQGEKIMKNSKEIFTSLFVLGLLWCIGIAAAQEDNTTDTAAGLVLTDDIWPYDGPIGADSPLYGLKITMEDIDESFTSNQSERLDKQIDHARLRIAEARREFVLNRTDSAQHALDLYWQKLNLTATTIPPFGSNATGLFHAQVQIAKHQFVLEQLLISHPNNTGLMRAYNNSLQLEEKFSEKTAILFNRTLEKNNKTILRAIHLEQKEQEHQGGPTVTATPDKTLTGPAVTESAEQQNEREKNKNKKSGTDTPVTTVTMTLPSVTETPQQVRQFPGNQQNNNNENKGKDNSRNK
jgi:hypothetical protein